MSSRKVIITCAVTGSIHTPSMSPHLPVTPDQIAENAVAAAAAGASILHLHARDPDDGRPTPDPDVFRQFLPRIKAETEAVINVTTGGGHNMTIDERLEGPISLQPEMSSLNMGSMNYGLFPALDRFQDWKHDWEPTYLENTRGGIFRNTFSDIEAILDRLGKGCGTRFEYECYDVGHLYNLAHFVDRGLVKPPFFVQMIFGILGGIGALFGYPDLSFQMLLGYVFSPVMYLLNIPWTEAQIAGGLFGTKVVLNEFVAFIDLGQIAGISERTRAIITFALCGFANFSSIAIQMAVTGGLAPNQRPMIAKLGIRK